MIRDAASVNYFRSINERVKAVCIAYSLSYLSRILIFTRGADKLPPEAHRLAKTEKLTRVMGPTVHNRLPDHVTKATNLASFKNRLKCFFLLKFFFDTSFSYDL
ncbi:PREDICTED: uncharacterized protein LOC106122061 [Papilio xuthus]|uniref:Uncharacterized protein LOC106122061 n=1 Tax=Papilio xuthus TaxID=66420 RepID=A0AAJ6ZIZ9_PAPXU|nr:PREDICTED: uncharacterized protein LOC106122061 [Papilio xuthus]